jgi:hypothetical protein
MEIIPYKHTWIRFSQKIEKYKRNNCCSRMCEPRKLLKISEWHIFIFKTSFIAFSSRRVCILWRKLNRKRAFQFEDLNEMIFAILWRMRKIQNNLFRFEWRRNFSHSFFSFWGYKPDAEAMEILNPFIFLWTQFLGPLSLFSFSTDYHSEYGCHFLLLS